MSLLHFKVSSKDDEYETPPELVNLLCAKFNVFPKLDVAATQYNKKFPLFYSKQDNALDQDWYADSWVNHPHSLHKEFVEKAFNEWKKNNIDIIMIIPANCGRTKYWHKFIEPYAEYRMVPKNITFLKDGKPSKHSSRNAYVCVIWRKQIV